MEPRRAATRARRLLRDLPAAASVGWRHLGRGPVAATAVGLRALPGPVTARVTETPVTQHTPVLRALGLAARGESAQALSVLRDAADDAPSGRARRRLVAAALTLDDADLAEALLAPLPAGDPHRPRLEALVAYARGHLAAAAAAADSGATGRWLAPGERGRQRLAALLHGELDLLTDQPPQAPAPPNRAHPVTGPGRRRRVLHLVTNALPEVTAGYTIRTQGIAHAQRATGTDAHVATRLGFPLTSGVLGAPAEVDVDGVPYHRSLPARWLPPTADDVLRLEVDHLERLVERLQPQVLHAHSKHLNAQAALAVRARTGIPVVYEVRGFLEETWRSRGHDDTSDLYRLSRQIETRCMQAADAVVTIAEAMRTQIVARGVPAERVLVVPNAVGQEFLAEPPDAAPLRAELAIAPDDVVLGVLSTLNAYEGVDTLVEATRLLHAEGAPVRLLVVGAGPAAAGLRDQARAAGLDDVVRFVGAVPHTEVRRYHAATDVFCVPRAQTPVTSLVTPLKPLEAMASGRPVVASDLPPLREIVQDGVTGGLATAGDPSALADALRPLVYDSPVRRAQGEAARRWVIAHRTWEAAAQRYGSLYDQIATTTGPGENPTPT